MASVTPPEVTPQIALAPTRDTSKHGRRLTYAQQALILKLAKAGQSAVSIAPIVNCSRQSVDYTLKAFSDTTELADSFVKAKALDSVTGWHKAAQKQAAKGRHEGSKELAEAALPSLRPQNAATNLGIVIAIGQPGQPLDAAKVDFRPPLSPVIDGESLPVSD